MEIFSIICLVIVIAGLQHLISWFWRKNYKDDSLIVLGFVLSVICLILTGVCTYYIILWGKNLV